MSIKLYTIRYSKGEMGQIPEQERLLHFMAGQLINEVNLYNRLTIAALNQATGTGPVAHANTAAALTLVKQLAGRVYEAGMILKEPKFSAVLDDYARAMPTDAQSSLTELRAYFDGDNLLSRVRNKVAAHVDLKVFRSGYVALPADEDLTEYLSPHLGNTLHFSGFTVGAFSLQRVTKQKDIRLAVDAVMTEAVRISSKFLTLFNQFMVVFFERHFPEKLEAMTSEKPLIIPDAPSIGSVAIPAFFRAEQE